MLGRYGAVDGAGDGTDRKPAETGQKWLMRASPPRPGLTAIGPAHPSGSGRPPAGELWFTARVTARGARLVARLYVDLQLVHSAICPAG